MCRCCECECLVLPHGPFWQSHVTLDYGRSCMREEVYLNARRSRHQRRATLLLERVQLSLKHSYQEIPQNVNNYNHEHSEFVLFQGRPPLPPLLSRLTFRNHRSLLSRIHQQLSDLVTRSLPAPSPRSPSYLPRLPLPDHRFPRQNRPRLQSALTRLRQCHCKRCSDQSYRL